MRKGCAIFSGRRSGAQGAHLRITAKLFSSGLRPLASTLSGTFSTRQLPRFSEAVLAQVFASRAFFRTSWYTFGLMLKLTEVLATLNPSVSQNRVKDFDSRSLCTSRF
jgi:hypothetical protein